MKWPMSWTSAATMVTSSAPASAAKCRLQHMFRNGHRLAEIFLVTLVGEDVDDGGDYLFGIAVHNDALCSLSMDASLDFMPSLSG